MNKQIIDEELYIAICQDNKSLMDGYVQISRTFQEKHRWYNSFVVIAQDSEGKFWMLFDEEGSSEMQDGHEMFGPWEITQVYPHETTTIVYKAEPPK